MDSTETAELPKIIEQLVASPARDSMVTDVRIGLGYTAVELDRSRLGLAYTFTDSFAGGCELFERNRSLIGQPAADLVRLVESGHPIEAAVGFAAANAVVNSMDREYLDGDVFTFLDLRKEDRVCMVGNFMPIVPRLRTLVSELLIFERIAEPVDDLIPSERIGAYLPDSQVVLLTATALINHTAEKILKNADHCREVVILGASTPLMPELYAGLPVTMLSGVVMQDADAVKQIVSQGGGMKSFSRFVRKVNIRVSSDSGGK